jgi:hypothetical protein
MSELKTDIKISPEPVPANDSERKIEYVPIYVNKQEKKTRKPKTQKQIEAFQAKCQKVRIEKVNEKKKEKEDLEMQMFQKFKEYINNEQKANKPKKEAKKKPKPPSPDNTDDEEPVIERVGQMDRPETANKVQEVLNNFRGSLNSMFNKPVLPPEPPKEYKLEKIREEPEQAYFQPKIQRKQQFLMDSNPNINIFR